MTFLRFSILSITISVIGLQHAVSGQTGAGNDEFVSVLLQAFTTGMFGGSPAPGPTPQELQPESTGDAFPEVTVHPIVPLASPEELILEGLESLEPSVEGTPDPSSEEGMKESQDDTTGTVTDEEFAVNSAAEVSASLEPSPELRVTPAPLETPEAIDTLVPVATSGAPIDGFSSEESEALNGSVTIFDPVRVNCGSFDIKNTFSQDTNQWFNPDSFGVEDPSAAAEFNSTSDTVLYTTYRSSSGNLTYNVPIPATGVWRVTLQWAEISKHSMVVGARTFTVYLNGVEFDDDLDVYRDSPMGGYSPLIRTHVINAFDTVVHIMLGQKVGEPMLSAFQITYISPFTAI